MDHVIQHVRETSRNPLFHRQPGPFKVDRCHQLYQVVSAALEVCHECYPGSLRIVGQKCLNDLTVLLHSLGSPSLLKLIHSWIGYSPVERLSSSYRHGLSAESIRHEAISQ